MQVLPSLKLFQLMLACAAPSISMLLMRSSMLACTHQLLMNFRCMTLIGEGAKNSTKIFRLKSNTGKTYFLNNNQMGTRKGDYETKIREYRMGTRTAI
jgi:hypothetical protein